MEDDDDDVATSKEKIFLGRDINSMPCFRETLLTSISSGLITGFAYFMFTSRTRRAVHVGYGTFFCVTVGYWIYCRYDYAYRKHQMKQIQAGAGRAALVQGTELDTNRTRDFKEG